MEMIPLLFNRSMISVLVFFCSNTLQRVLVVYSVTEMVCFDDSLDAAPCAKTMSGNGITTFILHSAQFITFNQTQFVIETLIAEISLK